MKKLFLTIGLLSFIYGGYYLQKNYTFVQLTTDQLAQVGSSTLQSSVLYSPTEVDSTYQSDVLLRVGSYAIVRNSSKLLVPDQAK